MDISYKTWLIVHLSKFTEIYNWQFVFIHEIEIVSLLSDSVLDNVVTINQGQSIIHLKIIHFTFILNKLTNIQFINFIINEILTNFVTNQIKSNQILFSI